METLIQFTESPGVAILLMGVLALEGLVLALLRLATGNGLPFVQIIAFLGAGACFSGALGAALAEMGGSVIGLFLAGAFVFHAVDLALRWSSNN